MISNVRRVCINTGLKDISSYDLDLIRGILRFSQCEGIWEFATQSTGHPILDYKETLVWRGDGIITAIGASDFLGKLIKRGIPTVSVCLLLEKSPTPRVTSNDTLVGIMGAKHLLSLPISDFAFVREKDAAYAMERERGFTSTIQAAGHQCQTCGPTGSSASTLQKRKLQRFLESLPKPVGVMADQDVTAVKIIQICKNIGCRIPGDVAIRGVNNDNTLGEMVCPTLTSIELDTEQIGFEAAALLERLMFGVDCADTDLRIPPLSVAERASTNMLYPDDQALNSALSYIHSHAHRFIKVIDVVHASRVSRRTLEKRFREKLGRTIQSEIQITHLKYARHLLQRTDWPLRRISRESGFREPSHFYEAFRRTFGKTPAVYRKSLV